MIYHDLSITNGSGNAVWHIANVYQRETKVHVLTSCFPFSMDPFALRTVWTTSRYASVKSKSLPFFLFHRSDRHTMQDSIDSPIVRSSKSSTHSMSPSHLQVIRIIRVTRLLRILRIMRLVRFVRSLRNLVSSIVAVAAPGGFRGSLKWCKGGFLLTRYLISRWIVFGVIKFQSTRHT